MHAERPWVFNRSARAKYSEEDYKLKSWTYIMETFFDHKQNIELQWGDKITNSCKSKSLKFKLDLHIAVLNDQEVVVDGMTAEVAKAATKRKIYGDKLKSILASKCHINNYLNTVPYITAEDIKRLKFPIMQIMGIFSSPCNMRSLRNDVEKLIDGLSLEEGLLEDLSLIYETSQIDPNDAIERIVEESHIKAFKPKFYYYSPGTIP
ncbi:hypothetical protein HPULCUR_011233 [Helicostylum pulchrum]|uniref:Uncharacterized protein n=1 Tax=Helicostylum pulchrum TaxID=562976 RepID=A0ABP9YFH3_9FUNG